MAKRAPSRRTAGQPAGSAPSAAPGPADAPDPAPRSLEAARALGPRLRGALLPWFAAHARDLPWRRTRDPYAIWVSEVMLQQTQVATALGYFERFLRRFPDPRALAAASDEDLLAAWSGLGYYRRARLLREGAQQVVEQHGGVLPTAPAEVRALRGVGPYTAGALLSIAFDASESLVDGNVARVLARWFELDGELGGPELTRATWSIARALLPPAGPPPDGPGAWNQALMELGATVCVPRQPRCDVCPVEDLCAARAAGRECELPRPKRRAAVVDVELELAIVERDGRWLLVRRAGEGRLGGLWELPTREVGTGTRRLFDREWPVPGLIARPGAAVFQLRHGITHHRIRARALAADAPCALAETRAGDNAHRFANAAEAAQLALGGIARKAFKRLDG